MHIPSARRLAGLLTLAAIAGACSDTGGTGAEHTAVLRVQLTDAPSVDFDSAVVWIGAITLYPVDGDPILVTDDGGRYDLLQLRNGITADLGEVEVEPGDYRELRMIVDSAVVGLADSYEFDDATTERWIKVPSGAQSGIKIKLSAADGEPDQEGITITPGETVLVVDFDVDKNFKIQGNPNTPAGIKDVLFTPVLRAVVRDVAASIAGTVSITGGGDASGLTVRATRDGSDPVEADAITESDGTYVIRFLAPGTYGVEVLDFTADPPESMPATVTVGAQENRTGVDFAGTRNGGG